MVHCVFQFTPVSDAQPLDLGHNVNLKYYMRDTPINLAMSVLHLKKGQVDYILTLQNFFINTNLRTYDVYCTKLTAQPRVVTCHPPK